MSTAVKERDGQDRQDRQARQAIQDRQAMRARNAAGPLNNPGSRELAAVRAQTTTMAAQAVAEARSAEMLAQFAAGSVKTSAQQAVRMPGITGEHSSLVPPASINTGMGGNGATGALAGVLSQINSATSMAGLSAIRGGLDGAVHGILTKEGTATKQVTNSREDFSRLDPREMRLPEYTRSQRIKKDANTVRANGPYAGFPVQASPGYEASTPEGSEFQRRCRRRKRLRQRAAQPLAAAA